MKIHLISGEVDLDKVPWEYAPGLVRNQRNGRQLPVRLAHLEGNRYQIWLAGQIYEVELASSGPRRAGSDASRANEHSLKASMPGTVLAVKVAVGQEVAPGDVLVVMESMKMELSLESPRAGKISRVCVEVGQLVELGSLLLELEK
jgi:biotin carboxyl carrier protein